jgi:hypothetical protein
MRRAEAGAVSVYFAKTGSGFRHVYVSGRSPEGMKKRNLKTGGELLPAHQCRDKSISLSVTAGDLDFVDIVSRRLGIAVARVVGDLLEQAIHEGKLEKMVIARRKRPR